MSTHVLRGRGFVDLLKCIMLPSTLLSYLVQWISTFHVISVIPYHAKQLDSNGRELTFELRHLHAHNGSRVLFSDVSKLQGILATKNKYTLRTEKVKIHKPRSHESFLKARWRSMYREESELLPWDGDEVDGPDVNDRETLLFLAKMTYNAYIEPQDEDWYDLGERWTDVRFFTLRYVVCLFLTLLSIIHLGGNRMRMASAAMYLQRRITLLSCCQ